MSEQSAGRAQAKAPQAESTQSCPGPVERGRLGLREREAAIDAMTAQELDILVVGGGVTGAGAALDAVTRGLNVGIVEASDWASGTSSRSSKLIHGGIRYLEQMNFGLVHEALLERGLLLQRLAPHLVKPVRFLYPVTRPVFERMYVGAGMTMYDVFSRTGKIRPGVREHRHLTAKTLAKAAPGLKRGAFRGGLVYSDAQMDDARFVTTLVRTALAYGAHAASRVKVTGFLHEGTQVVGVKAHDLLADKAFEIRAKQVINATGIWTDEAYELAGVSGDFQVRMSKGIHIVVPREKFESKIGLLLRTEKSVLFVIPWGKHWLIGTTDTDWHYDKQHPAATRADIDYLLERVNTVLSTPLTVDDIEGVFVGLRPLVSGASASTAKLSREHVVTHAAPGLVVIAGGKFTTYRVMGKDAVDEAVRELPESERVTVPESVTERVPLLGADGYFAMRNQKRKLAQQAGLEVSQVERLLGRYGSLTSDILGLLALRPELAEILPGTDEVLAAEVVYAVTHEGALSLDDVLTRRTRLAIETADRGAGVAEAVATLMAAELGWSQATKKAQVKAYIEQVEVERASQQELTDATANAVRLQVADVLPKPGRARKVGAKKTSTQKSNKGMVQLDAQGTGHGKNDEKGAVQPGSVKPGVMKQDARKSNTDKTSKGVPQKDTAENNAVKQNAGKTSGAKQATSVQNRGKPGTQEK